MQQWYNSARWPKDRVRSWVSAAVGVIFACLFVMTFIYFRSQAHITADDAIITGSKQLLAIFADIDAQCGILGFDPGKIPINFLDATRFSGREMNLEHPEKWGGPYLASNLTVQGVLYYVVTTKQGSYIAPGDGVRLSNGKVFGKDIALTPKTDIPTLIKQHRWLTYKGQPLITYLPIKAHEHFLAKLRVQAYGATLANP